MVNLKTPSSALPCHHVWTPSWSLCSEQQEIWEFCTPHPTWAAARLVPCHLCSMLRRNKTSRIPKAFLGSLTVFATFVTLCNTQCYFIPNPSLPNEVPTECSDANGVTHPMNSRWKTENCEVCFCSQEGLDCCNTAATPVNFDTEKCEKILNKETCTYTVVERENPEKPCEVSGWTM